jgi:hypothetical protein
MRATAMALIHPLLRGLLQSIISGLDSSKGSDGRLDSVLFEEMGIPLRQAFIWRLPLYDIIKYYFYNL